MNDDINTQKRGPGRPPKYKGMKKVSVYVRPEQAKWLRETESFNLSGFVRVLLDKRIPDEVFLLSKYGP